jgi:hypothetical protein
MGLSIWLLFNGIVYLALGFLFFFNFEAIVASLGIVPQHGSASIELVAVYGGLEAGFGILFLAALFMKRLRQFSVQLLTFSYLCFTVGRIVGIVGHDVTGTVTWYLLAFELVGLIISALMLKRLETHPGELNTTVA